MAAVWCIAQGKPPVKLRPQKVCQVLCVVCNKIVESNLQMKTSQFKDYSEFPLFLNAEIIAKVLGISPASSYKLMHESGFPVLKIGNRSKRQIVLHLSPMIERKKKEGEHAGSKDLFELRGGIYTDMP